MINLNLFLNLNRSGISKKTPLWPLLEFFWDPNLNYLIWPNPCAIMAPHSIASIFSLYSYTYFLWVCHKITFYSLFSLILPCVLTQSLWNFFMMVIRCKYFISCSSRISSNFNQFWLMLFDRNIIKTTFKVFN